MYPNSLKELIEALKLLPGVGEKSAERFAFSLLNMDQENIDFFANSLLNIKKKIKRCSICNSLTEDEICPICSDSYRNKDILCIVEDVKTIYLFEKNGIFNGTYHVLNGLISPLDGIDPEDIMLDKLIERINNGKFKEIILAFKPTVEGETTALYIKRILQDKDILITRLASGIPIGADMEYIDVMTLERALADRKFIE